MLGPSLRMKKNRVPPPLGGHDRLGNFVFFKGDRTGILEKTYSSETFQMRGGVRRPWRRHVGDSERLKAFTKIYMWAVLRMNCANNMKTNGGSRKFRHGGGGPD